MGRLWVQRWRLRCGLAACTQGQQECQRQKTPEQGASQCGHDAFSIEAESKRSVYSISWGVLMAVVSA